MQDEIPEPYILDIEAPDEIPDEIWRDEQLAIADATSAALEPPAEIEEETARLDYELTIQDRGTKDNKLIRTISGMAEIICRGNFFIADGFSGELLVFMDAGRYGGTYIEASRSIEYAIKQLAVGYDEQDTWTNSNKRKEVYHWINKGLQSLEDPDLRHINVSNGLIYISPSGEFIDHSSEWSHQYMTTVKLPVAYDPEAKCPTWEKFVADVFPLDAQHIAWELVALLMIPLKNKAASAIILKGEKNTGKSTFQNAVIAFLGSSNVSNLSLDKFGERFQDAQLKGKLANIVGELPNARLSVKAINTIKQLIGNDPLLGEIKNGATFMFKSYARCLFSCNEMPSCDSDDAFFDRFNIIPFNRTQFNKDPEMEKYINDTLSSPEELSGLLNKALEALPKVMKEGLKATASMKAALEDIVLENDSFLSWYTNYVEESEDSQTLFSSLHEHYKKAEPKDTRRQSNKSFGRDLKKYLPNHIKRTQFYVEDGSRPYGYKGIKLKDAPEEQLIDQKDFLEFDIESLT